MVSWDRHPDAEPPNLFTIFTSVNTGSIMKCSKCNYDVRGGKMFEKHFTSCDGSGPRSKKIRKPGGKSWSRGLTKETDVTIQKIGLAISKVSSGVKRKPLSQEHKNGISVSMKFAHLENRAWNIGQSRWNNTPSYPEQFFMNVIQNEFSDKNYVREYAVGRFSIDFAWVDRKLAIEIDGQQHDKEEYRQRDARKDALLISLGWNVLRIKWQDMYHDPQQEIDKCKEFLE